MKIILKDRDGNYKHLVTRNPNHVRLKEEINAHLAFDLDSSGIELAPTKHAKFTILMKCLDHVQREINEQLKSEYFNVVRVLTVIDDLTNTFKNTFQNDLSRAFANEAIRVLLTHYDLSGDLYTSVDYGRLDLYPAYPVSGGMKQRLQRNDLCEFTSTMGILLGGLYPSNFEYLKFGSYVQLKEALYPDTELHDKEFIDHEIKNAPTKTAKKTMMSKHEIQHQKGCCLLL
ncbi:hypothetical protein [Legionella waltersii]|uniref:Uncharacterized protein n=1 Tax=Legionella waltersii TaxID=66969 RepID=A0A0W1AGL3_9GAMM|nr:hypothetical protein [Legionella waltersii]KTD80517.1 hypothetical protein Lwal_1216 [Legionella waltersii]SNV09502.1 Uncharacterised protein [Legionella waltersii]